LAGVAPSRRGIAPRVVRGVAGALALGAAPAPLAVPADATLAPAVVETVEAALSATMAEHGIPGLSLALASGGEVRLAGGYGLADVENNVPAKALTVYRLASVSKPMTAVAVLQLAERGLLDLDAPVQEYCPAFPGKPWPVTARQLLGHLGGVRHYREGEQPIARPFSGIAEGLALFKDDPLAVEPQTRMVYSTYGYTVLGCAVEGASGRPFADYLGGSVFGPAGMERSRPEEAGALVPNRAQGYAREGSGDLRNSALADMSHKVPGGGLLGTAPDVARFALALADGRLLGPEAREAMLTSLRTRYGQPTGYGQGLSVGTRSGRPEAWHTGGQERVSNVLYWQPDSGVVVALLSNLERVQPPLLDLARRLADILQPGPAVRRPGGNRAEPPVR